MKRIGKEILEKLNKAEIDSDNYEHFSISSIIEQLKPEFDQLKVATKTHAKYFNDESSKYYRKSVDEILEMWKKKGQVSTSNGSMLDDYIGLVLEGESTDLWEMDNLYENELLKNKCHAAKNVINSLEANGFGYIAREIPVFVDIDVDGVKCRVHGRFDALFGLSYGEELVLYLIDWKNTSDISFQNSYEKMVGPCKKYDNANGNAYKIQVEIYKYAFVQNYGITNQIKLNIVQFPDEGSKILAMKEEDSLDEIAEMIRFAIKKIRLKREITKKLKEKN